MMVIKRQATAYPDGVEGDMMRRVDDWVNMLRGGMLERDFGKKVVALDGLRHQLDAWDALVNGKEADNDN